jgi:alpha-tubulin suppressor-like RCC1 family protein
MRRVFVAAGLGLGGCNALSGVGDFEVVPGATSTTSAGAGAGGAASSSANGGATSSSGNGGSGSGAGGAGGCSKSSECASEACIGGACATIVQIAAGTGFACAVLADGTAHCWGRNQSGQLGDGTKAPHFVPAPVQGLADVVEIAVSRAAGEGSDAHACARSRDGAVRCWGDNGDGQLGLGSVGDQTLVPALVSLPGPATRIATGGRHTCAIVAETVHCWGSDAQGQVGDGGDVGGVVPEPALVRDDALDVALGEDFGCMLVKVTGMVECWGANQRKQLGSAFPGESSGAPLLVPGTGAVAIAAGRDFACAVKSPSAVKCWGENNNGELATKQTGPPDAPPVDATALAEVDALALGVRMGGAKRGGHGCMLQVGGSVACWGDAEAGQIGNGTVDDFVLEPATASLSGPATSVSAGVSFTCALLASGALRCWGENQQGQLGTGMSGGAQPAPVPVAWP